MSSIINRRRLHAVFLILALVSVNILPATADSKSKFPTLVFSVEEAFVNSPTQNRDLVGLQRVADALKSLQNRYKVYVTLVASQTDQSKLFDALDVFAKARVPFYIDAWTSDSLAPPRPKSAPVNVPYDQTHGISRSISQLQDIKNRYGENFAGLRLHEVFAANLSVSLFHDGVDWFPAKSPYYPTDSYFQKSVLKEFFAFASKNQMKIIFSDPWWWASGNHDLHNPHVHQIENEAELAHIMHLYPRTGYLMYANNEPLKNKPDALYARIDSWPALFPANALKYAEGFGLSDQAWVSDRIRLAETKCPSHVIAAWAVHGLDQGAKIFEFEPYWYFFNFPRSDGEINNYDSFPDFEKRGSPTENFDDLIAAMDRRLFAKPRF